MKLDFKTVMKTYLRTYKKLINVWDRKVREATFQQPMTPRITP